MTSSASLHRCVQFLIWLLLAVASAAAINLAQANPPALMLATEYRPGIQVADYWVSEKLDGVRGRWDGHALYTRGGERIATPAWFTAGWPRQPLDGELWLGRNQFEATSSLIRSGKPQDPQWRDLHFMVFDLPLDDDIFEARLTRLRLLLAQTAVAWLQPVPQLRVANQAELDARLHQIVVAGGEGLMLHHRHARYRVGRSDTLLKYKPHQDAEARVIAHLPGNGKYTGMLGALLVERSDGKRFRLGSGLSDAQRAAPPPVGTLVTYRYNGLTINGLPRFARFLRVRHDAPPAHPP